MSKDILLLVILSIIFIILYRINNINETFTGIPDHDDYVLESQPKYSGLTSLFNPTSPNYVIPKSVMDNAIQSINATPTSDGYTLDSVIPEKYSSVPSDVITVATACEAIPVTNDSTICSAFDNSTFAKNCGISFDVSGTNINGQPHKGGLFLSPYDRKKQMNQFTKDKQKGLDPYKVFKPTLGTANAGTFAIAKDNCIIVKEKVDCATKQTFTTPNCSQCYTSGNFSRVGPETGRLSSTLYVMGNGTINITSPNNISLSSQPLTTTPVSVTIPENAEGYTFVIDITTTSAPTYISGYIEGPTPSGTFKLDMYELIKKDNVIQAKPRISGFTRFNNMKCKTIPYHV